VIGIYTFEQINRTSLQIGDYEDLKASSHEPYIAVRDAFVQHRKSLIKR